MTSINYSKENARLLVKQFGGELKEDNDKVIVNLKSGLQIRLENNLSDYGTEKYLVWLATEFTESAMYFIAAGVNLLQGVDIINDNGSEVMQFSLDTNGNPKFTFEFTPMDSICIKHEDKEYNIYIDQLLRVINDMLVSHR